MKFLIWTVVLSVGAFLVFAGVNAGRPEYAAQDAVRGLLKDPSSAQFFNVQIRTGTPYVCGFVNGKNSSGAYSGPARFAYDSSTQLAAIIRGPRDAFTWKDLAKGCFPQMQIPVSAIEVERLERAGSWAAN